MPDDVSLQLRELIKVVPTWQGWVQLIFFLHCHWGREGQKMKGWRKKGGGGKGERGNGLRHEGRSVRDRVWGIGNAESWWRVDTCKMWGNFTLGDPTNQWEKEQEMWIRNAAHMFQLLCISNNIKMYGEQPFPPKHPPTQLVPHIHACLSAATRRLDGRSFLR